MIIFFVLGKNSCTTTRYQQEQYHHQMQKLKGEKKEHCYLCKESKRRTLGAYLRGKSRTTSCSEIHEEKEEENDDDEVHEQQKNKQNKEKHEIYKNDNKDNVVKDKNTKTDKINIH